MKKDKTVCQEEGKKRRKGCTILTLIDQVRQAIKDEAFPSTRGQLYCWDSKVCMVVQIVSTHSQLLQSKERERGHGIKRQEGMKKGQSVHETMEGKHCVNR